METDITNSFKNSIISDEIISLAKDYSEIALDTVISDDALKHIPILGTVVSFYKIGKSLRERHFIKKIALFLSKLSEISDDEKEIFLSEMSKQDKYGESLFDKILLILEKLDETAKAEITGNLTRMYMKNVISKEKLLRFVSIVERAALYDLMVLHHHHKSYDIEKSMLATYWWSKETETALYNLGLLNLTLDSKWGDYAAKHLEQRGSVTPTVIFKINSLGTQLANLMFYDLQNEDFQRVMADIKITSR
ncbi:MAG: hypothetical protein JWQ79_3849 [Mucilaginibacter sp.]|nr:hypothetical protein [Mucilaginibacter sp.]